MRKVTVISLVLGVLLFIPGCGKSSGSAPNPATIKALLQTAVVVFEGAMATEVPAWNQTKFAADVAATINAWQVGANWKTQVLALLPAVTTDVQLIPGCSTNVKCQNLVAVFSAGVQSVITDLQNETTTAKVKGHPKYQTWAEYRSAWNLAAPPQAQIQ